MEEFLAFLFVFFLVFTGARLFETHMRTKRSGVDAEEHGELRARLNQLEDRVRVLERIVTDRSAGLQREISRLGE